MTQKEYLAKLNALSTEEKLMKYIEGVYGHALPTDVRHMILTSKRSIFFDDWRTLSIEEVAKAPKYLHINFEKLGIIPLIDCGDNNFIVYNLKDQIWSMFNITDEIIFKKRHQLTDFFK